MKKLSIKYFVLSILGIAIFAYYILHTTYYIPPTFAQNSPSCPAQSSNPRVKDGLISTPDVSGYTPKFSNPTGTCIVNPLASFASNKIATYADLKSIYYTQSKAPKSTNTGTTLAAITNGNIYNYTNTGGVSAGTYSYSGTAVVFIEGNLSITGNITGTASTGLVLVVKGAVNIAPSVTQIDAVIISSGKIYTAGAGCSLATNSGTNTRLVINGSLISIYKDQPQELTCTSNPPSSCPIIEFCRKLVTGVAGNDTFAAEVIIQQPKYLVILRNLFSDTLQKWSEIP